MTFKHGKFSDSPTLRSLERLAIQKGWYKDEPVVKTASPKLDLRVTNSLTNNIMVLCAGLRAKGFDEDAEEIEEKFIEYKKASKNELEDLVHEAHPKAAKVNDELVENIIEKHLTMLDVANKMATGKLSSSSDVLKAVKMVLGQASGDAIKEIKDNLSHAKNQMNVINKLCIDEGLDGGFTNLNANFDSVINNTTSASIKNLLNTIKASKSKAQGTWYEAALNLYNPDPEFSKKINVLFDGVINLVSKSRDLILDSSFKAVDSSDFLLKFNRVSNEANSLNSKQYPGTEAFFSKILAALADLASKFGVMQLNSDFSNVNSLHATLTQIEQALQNFKTKWASHLGAK